MTTEQNRTIENFIRQNRKSCWESSYERGQYCIGEDKIEELLQDIMQRPEKYGLQKKDQFQIPSIPESKKHTS